jgi:hypothetical protein
VPEVVEGDAGQTGFREQRREGPVAEVGRVDDTAALSCEDRP